MLFNNQPELAPHSWRNESIFAYGFYKKKSIISPTYKSGLILWTLCLRAIGHVYTDKSLQRHAPCPDWGKTDRETGHCPSLVYLSISRHSEAAPVSCCSCGSHAHKVPQYTHLQDSSWQGIIHGTWGCIVTCTYQLLKCIQWTVFLDTGGISWTRKITLMRVHHWEWDSY